MQVNDPPAAQFIGTSHSVPLKPFWHWHTPKPFELKQYPPFLQPFAPPDKQPVSTEHNNF